MQRERTNPQGKSALVIMGAVLALMDTLVLMTKSMTVDR
jgi:hypothetical protein